MQYGESPWGSQHHLGWACSRDGTSNAFTRLRFHPGSTLPETPLRELEDHGIDRKAVALFGEDRLDGAVAFGAQHVLHFHRLYDRPRLARLDLLPHRDGDRDDKARHRADEFLAGVGRDLDGHEPGSGGFAFRIDEGLGLDAAMEQTEAIEDGAHLHGDRRAVDGALPHRLPRLPGGPHHYHRPRPGPLPSFTDEPHADATGFACHREADLGAAEPHRTQPLAHHPPPDHLAGNPALP